MYPASPPETATGVGLGYGIAITISLLVLISAIMIASYACVRVKSGGTTDGTHDDYQRRENSGEVINIVSVLGLENPVIEAYPKVILGQSRRLPGPNNGPCSICLNEYREKDMIRSIPGCNHCFHLDCVDDWLRISATCPVCRNSPLASPSFGSHVPTPLSDFLPLAFNRR